MAISYTKLKSGWGVRSDQAIKEGDVVTVIVKTGANAGKTKTEKIKKVVWTDNKVWLAAIEKRDAPKGSARGNRPYECEECGERVTPGTQCWETGMTH